MANGSINLADMIMNPDKQKPKKKPTFKIGSPVFTDSPGFARDIDIPTVEEVQKPIEDNNEEDLFGNLKPSVARDNSSVIR